MIRGISGGQKKRVTTGEMIAGPKRTLFMVSTYPRDLEQLLSRMDKLTWDGCTQTRWFLSGTRRLPILVALAIQSQP